MLSILLHNERKVYVTQNPACVLDMNRVFQMVFSPCHLSLTYPSSKSAIALENLSTITELEVQI